ncbi:hypothetical protein [Arthrobacter sp. Z4-13]
MDSANTATACAFTAANFASDLATPARTSNAASATHCNGSSSSPPAAPETAPETAGPRPANAAMNAATAATTASSASTTAGFVSIPPSS